MVKAAAFQRKLSQKVSFPKLLPEGQPCKIRSVLFIVGCCWRAWARRWVPPVSLWYEDGAFLAYFVLNGDHDGRRNWLWRTQPFGHAAAP